MTTPQQVQHRRPLHGLLFGGLSAQHYARPYGRAKDATPPPPTTARRPARWMAHWTQRLSAAVGAARTRTRTRGRPAPARGPPLPGRGAGHRRTPDGPGLSTRPPASAWCPPVSVRPPAVLCPLCLSCSQLIGGFLHCVNKAAIALGCYRPPQRSGCLRWRRARPAPPMTRAC